MTKYFPVLTRTLDCGLSQDDALPHTRTVWTAGDFEEISAVHSPTIGLPVSQLTYLRPGLQIYCTMVRERVVCDWGGKQTHLTNQTFSIKGTLD